MCCLNIWFADPPPVSETKLNFLKEYKRPIPSIYNTVLQELIVQQHLMRFKRSYRYDPVFALGFVTVYEQLMEGYPSDEDRDAIFQAYIKALKEDPGQYRLEAWMCVCVFSFCVFYSNTFNSMTEKWKLMAVVWATIDCVKSAYHESNGVFRTHLGSRTRFWHSKSHSSRSYEM